MCHFRHSIVEGLIDFGELLFDLLRISIFFT